MFLQMGPTWPIMHRYRAREGPIAREILEEFPESKRNLVPIGLLFVGNSLENGEFPYITGKSH